MATNNDWFAPVDADDRRFVVLDVSESKKGDTKYFDALNAQINEGGAEAFIQFLLEYDIENFNHRLLPKTQGESKFDNKMLTADPIVRWWYHCLCEGEIMVAFNTSSFRASGEWEIKEPVLKTTDHLHASYVDWCRKLNARFIADSGQLAKKLNTLCPEISDAPRSNGYSRRKVIPILSSARQSFEKVMQSTIVWE